MTSSSKNVKEKNPDFVSLCSLLKERNNRTDACDAISKLMRTNMDTII